MDVIESIFNVLWYTLNSVIYDGIGIIYDLLLKISRTSIFSQIQINQFANRIYALVGIFMLFKVTLSLITYVVNPDSFTDKEKGMANIGKNIIISLILTLLVPYAFAEAYNLQTIILEDNALIGIVFGTGIETDEIDSAGDKMKFTLMYAFMQPNFSDLSVDSNESGSLASCNTTYQYKENGEIETRSDSDYALALNPECFGSYVDGNYVQDANGKGTLIDVFAAASFKDKINNSNSTTTPSDGLYQNYAQAISHQNFNLLHRRELINADVDGIHIIRYMGPLALLVGVAVLWLLLIFCIDVAVRSIKLGFYQMIAPIPILSYIDPKSGKDGMFKKWYKACFSTYLSLFIRLTAIYLAIYIITNVTQTGITDVVTGERITDWWVIIFVIVGALIFAKQLPKILEDLTGIKLEGFTLNPLKKIENEALGGKALSKVGQVPVNFAKGVGTGALVGGAALATGHGLRGIGKAISGGMKGEKFGKNFSNSYSAARESHKKAQERQAAGVSSFDVASRKFTNMFRGQTKSDRIKGLTDGLKKIQDGYSAYEKSAIGADKIAKYFDKAAQAAAARGDLAEQQKFETFRDSRISEIQNDKGKIYTGDYNGQGMVTYTDPMSGEKKYTVNRNMLDSSKFSANTALQQMYDNMESMVESINNTYSGIDGFDGVKFETNNLKKTSLNALIQSQNVTTNENNIKQQDIDNFAGNNKK